MAELLHCEMLAQQKIVYRPAWDDSETSDSCLPQAQPAPEAVQRPLYQETKVTKVRMPSEISDRCGVWQRHRRKRSNDKPVTITHLYGNRQNNVCDLIHECTSVSGQIETYKVQRSFQSEPGIYIGFWANRSVLEADRHHILTKGSGEQRKKQLNTLGRRWSCARQRSVPHKSGT